MKMCDRCGRVRFYSLNFIFSKSICNECYMVELGQSSPADTHEQAGDFRENPIIEGD
jgi:hypothetical protein